MAKTKRRAKAKRQTKVRKSVAPYNPYATEHHPISLSMKAIVGFQSRVDPHFGTAATVLLALIEVLDRKDEAAIAEVAKWSKKVLRKGFRVKQVGVLPPLPTRAEAFRELVAIVAICDDRSRPATELPMHAAFFVERHASLFSVRIGNVGALRVAITRRLRIRDLSDKPMVAKWILMAAGLSESRAANIMKSATSSVQ